MFSICLGALIGGIAGTVGMAVFAYGARATLERERNYLLHRLHFLEEENRKFRFEPVKDPRINIHQQMN